MTDQATRARIERLEHARDEARRQRELAIRAGVKARAERDDAERRVRVARESAEAAWVEVTKERERERRAKAERDEALKAGREVTEAYEVIEGELEAAEARIEQLEGALRRADRELTRLGSLNEAAHARATLRASTPQPKPCPCCGYPSKTPQPSEGEEGHLPDPTKPSDRG